MSLENRNAFLEQAQLFSEHLYADLSALPDKALTAFPEAHTALFVVDMVEGFAAQGALASARVGALVAPIAALVARCNKRGLPVVAFADTHTSDSLELRAYPSHCLRGTQEAAICPAIAAAGNYTLLEKNSTNGFLEPAFTAWHKENAHIDTYLVVGDCTDICILQFVLTALAWHNTRNLPLQMVVPSALVDTFEAPGHPADVLHALSLHTMQAAGATLCRNLL